MADEGYVPKQGASAMDVFKASRQVFAGENPKHTPVRTGVACPTCRDQNPPVLGVHVVSDVSGGLRCMNGHKFIDTDVLMAQKPERIPLTQAVRKQENYVPVTFEVPKEVQEKLQARFGERLAASLSSLMMSMLEDHNLMVAQADLMEIEKQLGVPDIKSSAHLKGAILAVHQQRTELMNQVSTMQANGQGTSVTPTAGGGVMLRRGEMIVWFDPQKTARMAERAKEKSIPLEQFVEEYMAQAIENNWI